MKLRAFGSVWFLPEENRWRDMRLLAMRDIGALVIAKDVLEFHGRRSQVQIAGIKNVSLCKQGRDFVNYWVKLEYGDCETAYFADGSWLGWGGLLGGTKALYEEVRQLASTS